MSEIEELISHIIRSIVDSPELIQIDVQDLENGTLYEVTVSKEDVGKIIGKKGRIAGAIRTISKAAGAKRGVRVMFNVMNEPLD